MKICGISDLHGDLPKVDPCDVVVIAGDIVPLQIQRSGSYSKEWFISAFADWVKNLPCSRVIFIGGNHDFWFAQLSVSEMDDIIIDCGLGDKLFYLCDTSYTYNGVVFYGTPWCEGPYRWAFSPDETHKFEDIYARYREIPDCDILITHQPPCYNNVGCSYYDKTYKQEWGSKVLCDDMFSKDVKYWFCGHIHSGKHGGVELNNNAKTQIYNVSLKDEDYMVSYKPTYIEL